MAFLALQTLFWRGEIRKHLATRDARDPKPCNSVYSGHLLDAFALLCQIAMVLYGAKLEQGFAPIVKGLWLSYGQSLEINENEGTVLRR